MATVKDPVCKMNVEPGSGKEKTEYKGETYHFCSNDCKKEFDKQPDRYTKEKKLTHK
jgi:P-type Cu+ transporter